MSLGHVVPGVLLCVVPLACGERSGDPVVALEGDRGGSGTDVGGTSMSGAPPAAGSGGEPFSTTEIGGPTGLCGACTNGEACGDANDFCLTQGGDGFCGRDCDEQQGCPAGYRCADVRGTLVQQCVPSQACPIASDLAPPLASIRRAFLARINLDRAANGVSPLVASPCLDGLAQGSALAYARTDELLGQFARECRPLLPNCACGWSGETELAVAEYGLDWATAVERASSLQKDGRLAISLFRDSYTEVGVGFWLSGDQAWIALSYR